MNREHAKELLPLITAFVEGKEVQVQSLQGEWCDSPSPAWGFPAYRYRIKPEPVKAEVWAHFNKALGIRISAIFDTEKQAKDRLSIYNDSSNVIVVKMEGSYER